MKHERITADPQIMVGKPVIKGTRVTVASIVEKVKAGMSTEEIIDAHPRLTPEDIYAALAYAADTIANEDIELSIPNTRCNDDRFIKSNQDSISWQNARD